MPNIGNKYFYHHFDLLSERLNIGKNPSKFFLNPVIFPKGYQNISKIY